MPTQIPRAAATDGTATAARGVSQSDPMYLVIQKKKRKTVRSCQSVSAHFTTPVPQTDKSVAVVARSSLRCSVSDVLMLDSFEKVNNY